MESQQQPLEYVSATSKEANEELEPASLAQRPPATQSSEQWQRIGTQISEILAHLPDYLGRFFNQYKQSITSVALIVAALVALKVALAVLDILNGIPLLAPTFRLVGIGYLVWFVNRYLIRASKRQEFSQEIQDLKEQVVGSEQFSESQS